MTPAARVICPEVSARANPTVGQHWGGVQRHVPFAPDQLTTGGRNAAPHRPGWNTRPPKSSAHTSTPVASLSRQPALGRVLSANRRLQLHIAHAAPGRLNSPPQVLKVAPRSILPAAAVRAIAANPPAATAHESMKRSTWLNVMRDSRMANIRLRSQPSALIQVRTLCLQVPAGHRSNVV